MDKDGELVKYMSNLPTYLERGVNIQENAFNVGVLDWGNLKKWQHKQQIKLKRPRGSSASHGDLSLPFLKDALPSHCTDHSHAPVHDKIHGPQSQIVSSEDLHSFESHDENWQHKIQDIDQAFEDYEEREVDPSRIKYLDKRTFQKNKILPSVTSTGSAYSPEAKVHFRGTSSEKNIKRFLESNDNRVVVPFARHGRNDLPEKYSCPNDISCTRLKESGWRSSVEKSGDSGVGSNVPLSHIPPCIFDCNKQMKLKQCSSVDSGPSTCSSNKPVEETAPAPPFPETSRRKDMRRCQSSFHRRLLDSVLKAEENVFPQCNETLPQSSVSMDAVCKPSNSPSTWSSRLKCCRTVDVSDSQLGKNKMSAQALLRVAFKNGHPLFTFVLNSESDILAASVKKLSTSRKNSCKWTYTLFKIPAVKREIADKRKGSKVGTQHCYPLVVSQLNVSEVLYSNSTRQKEFVLSPVESRKDEIAGIIVQIQPTADPNTVPQGCHCELSKLGSKGHLLDMCSCPKDGENIQDKSLFSNKNFINATVILPGGVQSLPSKSEASSLIERWKSGGLCDCGGWDLDCRLRILVNQNHLCNELRSPRSCTSNSVNKLAVFTQVPILCSPLLNS